MCSLIVLQRLTEAVLLFIDTYILCEFLKTDSKLMTQKSLFFLFSLYSWQHLHNYQYQYISWCYTSIFTIIKKIIEVNLVNDIYLWFSLINPTCGAYVLQSLQGHSHWIHFFAFLLKISRASESFIAFDKMSYIFGTKKGTVLLPCLTEFTLCLVRTLFSHKL